MKPVTALLASPVLCLGILAGITLEKRTHLGAEDAEPYHARAKAAINAMPWKVEVGPVLWTAEERQATAAAVQLLRPNEILSRHYTETSTGGPARSADVLIVQCRDSRDMTGHYPPVCYPNTGFELAFKELRETQVKGTRVPFTEYYFEKDMQGRPKRICIYNFFVVPGHGVVPDIQGVNDAAEDYQRRFFGAAQFQVLMPDDVEMSRGKRDEVFNALLRSNANVFEVLTQDRVGNQ